VLLHSSNHPASSKCCSQIHYLYTPAFPQYAAWMKYTNLSSLHGIMFFLVSVVIFNTKLNQPLKHVTRLLNNSTVIHFQTGHHICILGDVATQGGIYCRLHSKHTIAIYFMMYQRTAIQVTKIKQTLSKTKRKTKIWLTNPKGTKTIKSLVSRLTRMYLEMDQNQLVMRLWTATLLAAIQN
jgi:hypothetical protein